MKLYILLLFLFGCHRENGVIETETNASTGIARYENSEVICYKLYDKSLQCKWKDIK